MTTNSCEFLWTDDRRLLVVDDAVTAVTIRNLDMQSACGEACAPNSTIDRTVEEKVAAYMVEIENADNPEAMSKHVEVTVGLVCEKGPKFSFFSKSTPKCTRNCLTCELVPVYE